MRDCLDRSMRDLRVSVTDRCNFRCTYCMPRDAFGPDHPFLSRHELLTYEQTARLVAIFAGLGVRKVRVTGGEPLLRRDLHRLVGMLAAIKPIEDLALTTNGVLLPEQAERLAEAGLNRVTVSLDSLDDNVLRRMVDVEVHVADVLAGIDAASDAGLGPVKINAVVRRGVNDHTIVDLVRHFRGTGHIVRLIEYMDVGTTNGWRLDEVVPAREMIERIGAEMPLEPIDPNYRGEVARRWRHRDGGGEIGIITSVTQPFCSACTRARLSPEGRLFTCLFASSGHDLRSLLNDGADDERLARSIREAWSAREDRYSEVRTQLTARGRRIEMSYIGG
ncbi:MAG: GTP 3',8-cyclase MoaA [Phycisphaeraceae bacterium]|nr:GTP 3',8-cyclase MoaA [Phycisphaeraceae bacterium]